MKCIFIVFYFGQLPEYFPLFLDSCRSNEGIYWRIYTDQSPEELVPLNVEIIFMTFAECRQLFKQKLNFPVSLQNPKKLCDFKPLYGYILEDTIRQYSHWGHCDLDMIWGNLYPVIEEKADYDKIFSLGNCSVYRNTPEVNRRTLSFEECKKALQSPVLQGFDEWGSGKLNSLFPGDGFRFYKTAPGADLWPERTPFFLSAYQPQKDRYAPELSQTGIIRVRAHHLYWCYKENDRLREVEYPYVHMQKRRFAIKLCSPAPAEYYVIPGLITDAFSSPDEAWKTAKKCRSPVDMQWFRLKWFNLNRRLKLFMTENTEL